jgi:hypothetical protein
MSVQLVRNTSQEDITEPDLILKKEPLN